MTDGDRTIATAVRVAEVLHQHEVDAVVIGAIALAVHGYPRATSDIDLAVNTNPFESLREVQRTLRGEGPRHCESPWCRHVNDTARAAPPPARPWRAALPREG